MKFSVSFRGGPEFLRNLKALPPAVQGQKLLEILLPAAEPMRVRMGELAPRGPDRTRPDQPKGHIADSMTINQTGWTGQTGGGRGRRALPTEMVVAVGPEHAHYYGLFWEYGTVKLSAKPFMRPAFDTTAPQSLGIILDGIWAAIAAANSEPAGGGGVP